MGLANIPDGFNSLRSCGVLTGGTLGLVQAITEVVEQEQLSDRSASPRAQNSTWFDLHSQIQGVDLAEGDKMPGRFIRLGIVAYVFQNLGDDFRRLRGQFIPAATQNVVQNSRQK